MHRNEIIYALICINNHVLSCLISMLSRGTSNYPNGTSLFDPTHMMSMADLVTLNVKTLRMDSGCSLEKEFT